MAKWKHKGHEAVLSLSWTKNKNILRAFRGFARCQMSHYGVSLLLTNYTIKHSCYVMLLCVHKYERDLLLLAILFCDMNISYTLCIWSCAMICLLKFQQILVFSFVCVCVREMRPINYFWMKKPETGLKNKKEFEHLFEYM